MQKGHNAFTTLISSSKESLKSTFERRPLHPLPPKPPCLSSNTVNMQHDPRLKRTTTSLYHRRSSPIKVDKIREERPANSHPLVPIPNGAAVKAPVTVPTAPPNREVENIQHSED
uniref:Uncharacterized protein n=1 Tax=Psilocybe cubensis TaxID=181762 RepID=A0A8H8CFW2_PSICU